MRKHLVLALAAGLALVGFTEASAQPNKGRDWTGQLAAGYAWPQGDAGDVLDEDWILQGGATYRPDGWPVFLSFELAWHEFDIEERVTQIVGASGGFTEVWNATANVNWAFIDRTDKRQVYLTGGVGYYDMEAKLTDPGLYSGWICDPWYWWCYPGIVVGDVIVGEKEEGAIGYNAGIGVNFSLRGGGQIYLESRYHVAELDDPGDYEYLPFTVGFRF